MAATYTKEQLTDAAVEEVRRRVQFALDGEDQLAKIYIEAYQVTPVLIESGMLAHAGLSSSSEQERHRARDSLDGKVKRLLDAECTKPDHRLLRFSSVKDGPLPQLNGQRRTLYYNAAGYTTQEAYERAVQAVEVEEARLRAGSERAEQLMVRAESIGMPLPGERYGTFTYGLDNFEVLVERFEELLNG